MTTLCKTLSTKAQQILKFESQLTQLVWKVFCVTPVSTLNFPGYPVPKKCKVQTDFRSLIIFVLIFILFFKTWFSFYSILVLKLIFVIVFVLVNENITAGRCFLEHLLLILWCVQALLQFVKLVPTVLIRVSPLPVKI